MLQDKEKQHMLQDKHYLGRDPEGRLIPTPGFQASICQTYRRAGLPFTPPDHWKLAQKFMAHDAAPDPAPRQSQKDIADHDPDPIIKCFNGVPYAEGLRRFNEYKAQKGKK